MKILKIMNTILLLSVLLFSACSKEEDSSPKNDDPQLIGIWLSNEYIPSFLFGYEQGFELLEDSFYYAITTPFPAAPIDTTFTIIDGAGGKWFLNKNKDSITFLNETLNDSISYRIEALTNDSLILFGRSLADTENKEHLFIKKK
jgi:hypothetical protein